MRAFLAGAIEYAPDGGKKWRRVVESFIINRLRHSVYNPVNEESKILPGVIYVNFHQLKKDDPEKFKFFMREIIDHDIEVIIKEVDYIICYWDGYARIGGGTYGELTLAYYFKKSVYMVTEFDINSISSWIIGCVTGFFLLLMSCLIFY